MKRKLRYKRLLLKVSGEVLGGIDTSIDFDRVGAFAVELKQAVRAGCEVAVVIGGGNILRGYRASERGVRATTVACTGLDDAAGRSVGQPAARGSAGEAVLPRACG